jgi:hypothetical protein
LNHPAKYHRITAFLLAVLLLQVVVLKEVHHLLEHDHDAVAHCEASSNETHLHGEEYHPEDCFLCVFHFAPATLSFEDISIEAPLFPVKLPFFSYKSCLTPRQNWHFQLRGPPALAA